MRRLLMATGQVHIPPESYVLGALCRGHLLTRWLPWPDYVRWALGRFQFHPEFKYFGLDLRPTAVRLYEHPGSSLAEVIETVYRDHMRSTHGRDDLMWGDKTPLNTQWLSWIDRTFPQARYVEMVRDGVDVVASYVRTGLQPSSDAAARRWTSAIKSVERLKAAAPERVLTVRYEELVDAPEGELERVADFLGLGAVTVDSALDVDLGDTHMPHLTRSVDPIDPSAVGAGRREEPELSTSAVSILDPVLEQLGYAPANHP